MSDLPTKPGPYYWRKSDGDKWVHTSVVDCLGQLRGGNARRPYQEAVSSMGGQWLPIPTAEELVELKAAKKMVDDKHDGWAIFQRGEFCLSVPTQDYVIRLIEKITGYPWMTLSSEANYTCEPVTIIRKEKR